MTTMYEIHHPGESVLGGCVRWHSATGSTLGVYQYAVERPAQWPTREAAQAVADAMPDATDWRGGSMGRPVVVAV